MAKQIKLKRTQVKGKKYDLPEEEIRIEKLVNKGLNLQDQLSKIKDKLELVKSELIKIAKERREGMTAVKMKGVSGESVVTFRESYICKDDIEEIQQELGSLFDRFFTKKIEFKAEKDLKQFLDGTHAYGLEDPEPVKKMILSYVTKKETKPNVKLVDSE